MPGIYSRSALGLTLLLSAAAAFAQRPPATLPGAGMAGHDFFYAGEAKTRDMYIVRAGKVAWEHHDEATRGEISDAQMASNGNIVMAHQFGVQVIDQAHKVLWSYPAEEKHEIHTAQFIGNDRVIFVQSGPRPRILVANIPTGRIERTLALSAGDPGNTHGQLRHARLTPNGTYLLAQMDLKRAVEIDATGKEVWSLDVPTGIWSANRLPNGNTLVAGRGGIAEYDRNKAVVFAITPDDLKDYRYTSFQRAYRLPNGNTLLNNWVNQWSPAGERKDMPPQWLELTPGKKVVWALNQWSAPDLGPSTTLQLLDAPDKPELAHFGDIH